MTTSARKLASGHGWMAQEFICTAGPDDRPFEERHDAVCIAAVTHGFFQYRTGMGATTLAPGALLLGNAGTCFECGHEHGVGDRCLSFHFSSAFFEEIVASIPGARRVAFTAPRLPPLPALLPLIASAQAARTDAMRLEEIAIRLAGAVVALLAQKGGHVVAPTPRDERRIADALRRIAANGQDAIPITDLAREVGLSPYHFLRVFRSVVGMTPHQFVLAERLRAAAVRLRDSDDAVSDIAFDAGFGDLSTFNRRFRRVMGASPREYRRG